MLSMLCYDCFKKDIVACKRNSNSMAQHRAMRIICWYTDGLEARPCRLNGVDRANEHAGKDTLIKNWRLSGDWKVSSHELSFIPNADAADAGRTCC